MPHILRRAGPLPAFHAFGREEIAPGRIYVAQPDFHLLIADGATSLSHGPTENGHRPSIDVLFRSAAYVFRGRTIGVVLSGMLDDGTAGLAAIKAHGGTAIAQDPRDALYPSMPRSAIERVAVDYVGAASEIAERLVELVGTEAGGNGVQSEKTGSEPTGAGSPDEARRGASPFVCPSCGGTLFDVGDDGDRYRCRVGHAYTAETLLAEQDEHSEGALFSALRSLEEQADLAGRLATRAFEGGREKSADYFRSRAEAARRKARSIQRVLDRLAPAEGEQDTELAGEEVREKLRGA